MKGDWHVHTSYTDGKNTVFEYCEQAEKNGLGLIAFTEHVRKELDYDFGDFVSDVHSAKDKFDLEILVGCEAKVLDERSLDVSSDVLKDCELVLGAFHRFAQEENTYLEALKRMLRKPEVDVWAHPTLFAVKNGFSLKNDEIKNLLEIVKKHKVLIEINLKYKLPNENFILKALKKDCKFVIGSDAHCIDELLEKDEIKGVEDRL